MIRSFLALVALTSCFLGSAQAAEVKALVSTAMKTSVEILKAQFEQKTGHTVTIEYGPSGNLTKRIVAGEAVDCAILGGEGVNDLVISGKLAPDSALEVASSMIGANAVPCVSSPKGDANAKQRIWFPPPSRW